MQYECLVKKGDGSFIRETKLMWHPAASICSDRSLVTLPGVISFVKVHKSWYKRMFAEIALFQTVIEHLLFKELIVPAADKLASLGECVYQISFCSHTYILFYFPFCQFLVCHLKRVSSLEGLFWVLCQLCCMAM